MIWEDKDPKCPRDAKPVSSTQIVEGTRLLNNRDLASPDRDSGYPHLNLGILHRDLATSTPEMEIGWVDRHWSGQPAGRVAGRVEILRPAGQAG